MSILGIHHVQLAAPPHCEQAARAFYGGLLGLQEIEKPAPLRDRGGVWFTCGAQQLHIGVLDSFTPATKAHPALELSDIQALEDLAQQLVVAGMPVRFEHDIDGLRRLHTADPWGNRLELLSRCE
ncbi:MAG: VOC family protein [Solirubrobacteraceae bacterium]